MPLDDKAVIELWETIHREMRNKVSKFGKPAEWAEDIAQETITRFLEITDWKGPRARAIHWCRRTAFRLFVDFTRREKGDISFDGVARVSPAEGEDFQKYHAGSRLKHAMISKITETRDPAILAEQRQFLQLIDPEWREHMEDSTDYTRGHKLDQLARKKIQRRARRLIGGTL